MLVLTENKKVNALGKINFSGDIIPNTWFKEITKNGKPDLGAIFYLSGLVYWYKPFETVNENGQMTFKKKFKGDILRRSYRELSEIYGFSEDASRRKLKVLESMGLAKRVIDTSGVNSKMYVGIHPENIFKITFPGERLPEMFKGDCVLDTGCFSVDFLGKMDFRGNIVPKAWYKSLKKDGIVKLNAIAILSEIVYWYRPTEIYERLTGNTVWKKKFKEDLLQLSYKTLSEKTGLTKKQLRSALEFLEEVGAVKRIFRTVKTSSGKLGNVMFLDIDPDVIFELTYPKSPVPYDGSKKVTRGHEDVLQNNEDSEKAPTAKPETEKLRGGKKVTRGGSKKVTRGGSKKVTTYTKITNTKIRESIYPKDTISYRSKPKKGKEEALNSKTNENKQDAGKKPVEEKAIEKIKTLQEKLSANKTARETDVLDVVFCFAKDILRQREGKVRVNGESVPVSVLKNRISGLEEEDFRNIEENINTSPKIKNLRNYLATVVYNAPYQRLNLTPKRLERDFLKRTYTDEQLNSLFWKP